MDYNARFDQTDETSGPPIIALLQKLAGLKKLTLNMADCSQRNVQNILEVCQNITHFVIGSELRVYTGGPLRHKLSIMSEKLDLWNFAEIFNVETLKTKREERSFII